MPTRMPYSCQPQFWTSGTVATPAGEVTYWRGTALLKSQSSTLTTM